EEKDAARGHLSRDEAASVLRKAIGTTSARKGRGGPPIPQGDAQTARARGLLIEGIGGKLRQAAISLTSSRIRAPREGAGAGRDMDRGTGKIGVCGSALETCAPIAHRNHLAEVERECFRFLAGAAPVLGRSMLGPIARICALESLYAASCICAERSNQGC